PCCEKRARRTRRPERPTRGSRARGTAPRAPDSGLAPLERSRHRKASRRSARRAARGCSSVLRGSGRRRQEIGQVLAQGGELLLVVTGAARGVPVERLAHLPDARGPHCAIRARKFEEARVPFESQRLEERRPG